MTPFVLQSSIAASVTMSTAPSPSSSFRSSQRGTPKSHFARPAESVLRIASPRGPPAIEGGYGISRLSGGVPMPGQNAFGVPPMIREQTRVQGSLAREVNGIPTHFPAFPAVPLSGAPSSSAPLTATTVAGLPSSTLPGHVLPAESASRRRQFSKTLQARECSASIHLRPAPNVSFWINNRTDQVWAFLPRRAHIQLRLFMSFSVPASRRRDLLIQLRLPE